jgi:hypothetical protein
MNGWIEAKVLHIGTPEDPAIPNLFTLSFN